MKEQNYIPKANENERVYGSINSIRSRRAKFEDNPIKLNELTALGRMLLEDTKLTELGRMLLGEDGLA